jgi:hypothetical protein
VIGTAHRKPPLKDGGEANYRTLSLSLSEGHVVQPIASAVSAVQFIPFGSAQTQDERGSLSKEFLSWIQFDTTTPFGNAATSCCRQRCVAAVKGERRGGWSCLSGTGLTELPA